MKVVFFGNGNRGIACLNSLYGNNYNIELVIGHPIKKQNNNDNLLPSVVELAEKLKIKTMMPVDPNEKSIEEKLKKINADLFILAGYGKIIKDNIISIPKIMCINLHGGKLPKYRGSSPMNWALINGDNSFSLSIIKVDKGVDTGNILLEKKFDIDINNTIADLHNIANNQFPLLLLELLNQIKNNNYNIKKQDNNTGSYYPLRFPDDGFILWDLLTAEQIHNRIRALTEPYPCAFTYYKNRKVKLLSSKLYDFDYYGEPGKVYKKSNNSLLVAGKDKCLWITKAVFDDDSNDIYNFIERYNTFLTIRSNILDNLNR